jgi:hypothetical protein
MRDNRQDVERAVQSCGLRSALLSMLAMLAIFLACIVTVSEPFVSGNLIAPILICASSFFAVFASITGGLRNGGALGRLGRIVGGIAMSLVAVYVALTLVGVITVFSRVTV